MVQHPTSGELPDVPRKRPPAGGLRHHLAGLALRLGGWTAEGDPPDLAKYVIVAAPHTSWWDGIWMVTFAWWWGLRLQWLVKADVAPRWLRWFFRSVGGVLIDRSGSTGLVGQLASEFARSESLHLAIPPEGTRKRGEYWRSGFYYVAKEAGVPICLSNLDYGRRKGGFGLCFHPTGDLRADMDRIREFYRDTRGLYEAQFTPPWLKEEEQPASP